MMAEEAAVKYHIYCLCGQKMRVADSMFGRPGKCVACRQKLWVPRREEFPGDTKALRIEDHPELMRRRGERVRRSPAIKYDRAAGEHVPQPDTEREVPLDTLEPLRVLCSLEQALQEELDSARDSEARSALSDRLDRVRKARERLNSEMGQRLTEAVVDLSSTEDKINRAGLAARAGELDFREYLDRMGTLRERRELLERRRQNLRGWLATDDPSMAGGLESGATARVPESGLDFSWPQEPRPSGPLAAFLVDRLREAFDLRERAERRVREAESLNSEGAATDRQARHVRQACAAAEARAGKALAFARDRLVQCRKDRAYDRDVLDAEMGRVEARRKSGEVTEDGYRESVRALNDVKADVDSSAELVDRALSAGTARDLPSAQGTARRRFAGSGPARKRAVPWYLAAGAALAVALVVGFAVLGSLLLRPRPALSVQPAGEWALAADAVPVRPVRVMVANRGAIGMTIGVSEGAGRRDFVLRVEDRDGAAVDPPLASQQGVPARSRGELLFELPPGQYQVSLHSERLGIHLRERIDLPRPIPDAPPAAEPHIADDVVEPDDSMLPPEPGAEEQTEEPARPAPPALRVVTVELRGLATAPGRLPQFQVLVTMPDGSARSHKLGLDDVVHEDWHVMDFNPAEKTVTLSDGERVLVLRSGEPAVLGPVR